MTYCIKSYDHLIIILLVFISRNDEGRYEIHIDRLALHCRMKILQDELLVSFTFRTSFSIQLGLGCHHFTTFTAIFQSIFPVHFHVARFSNTFYHHDAIFFASFTGLRDLQDSSIQGGSTTQVEVTWNPVKPWGSSRGFFTLAISPLYVTPLYVTPLFTLAKYQWFIMTPLYVTRTNPHAIPCISCIQQSNGFLCF